MAAGQPFKTDGELDVGGADNVLDLEVRELRVEPELLYDTSVLSAGKLRVVFALRTRYDHLARGEDESSCLGFSDTHDHSCKTLQVGLSKSAPKKRQKSAGQVSTFGLYSALRA